MHKHELEQKTRWVLALWSVINICYFSVLQKQSMISVPHVVESVDIPRNWTQPSFNRLLSNRHVSEQLIY